MGRIGLIDGAKVLSFSTLPEVKELELEQSSHYANMAEAVAARYAIYDSGKEGYVEDMSNALCLIAEQLTIKLAQVPRRIDALALESESQGPHSYRRILGKLDEFIPPLAREILDYYAITPPKHGVIFTKVFVSPMMTDVLTNPNRMSRSDEESDEPFIDFDENMD